jgi:hypothetical protein
MKQAAEYRQHAAECRVLLKGARTDDERQMIINIAEAWKRLAEDREQLILRGQIQSKGTPVEG